MLLRMEADLDFKAAPYLGVHEVKVLCLWCKCSDCLLLAAVTVQAVIVIQANDGGHVADEGVAVGVSACNDCRRLGGTPPGQIP